MARTFEGPLTQDDVDYLRQRWPQPYVLRQVELYGMAKGANLAPADEPVDVADEDLIGHGSADLAVEGSYDPGEHTVDEVNAYLKTVSSREREAILELERDGRNRSSITG